MLPAPKRTFVKQIFLFTLVAGFLLVATLALAQETSPANPASPSATIDTDKVKALKDKLATKIAELRENQTRGFFGEISNIAKTSFTLVTNLGEVKVRFSEDSLIFELGDKRTEAETKDLKNTLSAAVLGLFDADASQLTAKVIFLQSHAKHFSGTLTDVDKVNGVISVKGTKDEILNFDYEKTTKAGEYQPDAKEVVAKSGLSRFKINDYVDIWALPSEDDQQKYKIVKILRISKDVLNPSTEEASPSATPKT